MRSILQHIAIFVLMTMSCYQIYTNMPTNIHLCSNIENAHLWGVDLNNKMIISKIANNFTSVVDNICLIANSKNVHYVSAEFVLNRTNYNKAPTFNNVVLINILALGIESFLLGLL